MNKKLLLSWTLTGLMFSMLVTSCEQKTSLNQEAFQENASFEALQQEINSFDVQFQQQNQPELRGWIADTWRAIKKFFSNCGAVVVADVTSIVDNSTLDVSKDPQGNLLIDITVDVGAAVSASVATGKERFCSTNIKTEVKWEEWQNTPSYSMEYTGSIVGQAHNKIINELCDLYGNKTLEEISDEQMYQDIVRLTANYFEISPSELGEDLWKSFQKSAERICTEVAHKTAEEAITYLREYPKGDKRELNIIADYLVKIQSLPTEILRMEYAKGFAEKVESSTVSQQSKKTIIDATATGLNSIALWEQK